MKYLLLKRFMNRFIITESEKKNIIKIYNEKNIILSEDFNDFFVKTIKGVDRNLSPNEINNIVVGSVPFTNSFEGNKFRRWVNDNYPKLAKSIDLDRESPYFNNINIKKAYYYNDGTSILGKKFQLIGKNSVETEKLKTPSKDNKNLIKHTDCIGLDVAICPTLNSNINQEIGRVAQNLGCSRWAINCLKDYNEKINRGHAWFLFKNLKPTSKVKFNLFKDLDFNKLNNLTKKNNVDFKQCEKAEKLEHSDGMFPNILNTIETILPYSINFDVNNLEVGDIVGLYLRESTNKSRAFCESSIKNDFFPSVIETTPKDKFDDLAFYKTWADKTIPKELYKSDYKLTTVKNKFNVNKSTLNDYTFNTHIGFVGAVKNGVPLIFHNIDGKLYSTPATMLKNKNFMMITWVLQDPVVKRKVDEMMRAKNNFTFDSKISNDLNEPKTPKKSKPWWKYLFNW